VKAVDSFGVTDLHSHLVPGVDDGARTLEEALEGLGRLQSEGVETLVTTPHLDASVTLSAKAFEARMMEVDSGWRELAEAVGSSFPGLSVFRGHEVMLDVPHPDFSDPRTRLSGGDFVLVEWPSLRVPPATGPALDRLRDDGYRVVLAHPERYHGLDGALHMPGEWRDRGALLQVNYGSLAGRYGDGPRRRAFTLLERGWVDLFSTDFHGRPHLSIYLKEVREAMADLGGEEQFRLLSSTNPSRILGGGEPLPVPPLQLKKSFWDKLRDVFQGPERW
jgi:protein-tyrosine phosphatase